MGGTAGEVLSMKKNNDWIVYALAIVGIVILALVIIVLLYG